MRANKLFLHQPKHFWAYVRTIGQEVGYTERGTGKIKIPTFSEITTAFEGLGLNSKHIFKDKKPTDFGVVLMRYFVYRAKVLNSYVEPRLMDASQAKKTYSDIRKGLKWHTEPPMNKQKGKKKQPAYFTAIINMLVSEHSKGVGFDSDPRSLTTITVNDLPLRTLARRVDGAIPSHVNPIAVWEIKEYYYTTTFGSRVADGVYESLLDGMELEELREHEGVHIHHYLMIDSHFTWWECGKSYLCRIIDMLHMGYLDEVLFGREVTERLPIIVRGWMKNVRTRKFASDSKS